MKKRSSPRILRRRRYEEIVLKALEPVDVRLTSTDIAVLLKINKRQAAVLLYDMTEEGKISKEKVPHPKYQMPTLQYFIDPNVTRPENWRDKGLQQILDAMGGIVRKNLEENDLACLSQDG